jgi:hypothetical protein
MARNGVYHRICEEMTDEWIQLELTRNNRYTSILKGLANVCVSSRELRPQLQHLLRFGSLTSQHARRRDSADGRVRNLF